MKNSEKLAAYVNHLMKTKGLSGSDVHSQAKRQGFSIALSYVNRVRIGNIGNMTTQKQIALAHGLGVLPGDISDIMVGKAYFDEEKKELVRIENDHMPEIRNILSNAEGYLKDEQLKDLLTTIKRLVLAMKIENFENEESKVIVDSESSAVM